MPSVRSVAGRLTETTPEYANVSSPISVSPSGRSTLSSDAVLWNTLLPIVVRLAGSSIAVSPEPMNTLSPIELRRLLLSKETEVSEEMASALSPIERVRAGMTILCSEVPMKA